MNIAIIEPHGFCAGVAGALRKARELAALSPSKRLYCLHALVHNELVVRELEESGFVFVEDVAEVPEGETVLFSAHGGSPAVREAAERRHLKIVDATCPFVARVHAAAQDFAARGLAVVVVGKGDHAEVRGIVGEVPGSVVVSSVAEARTVALPEGSLGVVSQTTMNADEVAEIVAALRARRSVEASAEVCQATKERQEAVRAFRGDALLVLGSANSSNTRRLCEVAGCRAFQAGTLEEVRALDLTGVGTLGVTSGASTPESFFEESVVVLREASV